MANRNENKSSGMNEEESGTNKYGSSKMKSYFSLSNQIIALPILSFHIICYITQVILTYSFLTSKFYLSYSFQFQNVTKGNT